MEYFLRQLDPEAENPIIITMDRDDITIGRQMQPSLTGYVQLSRIHARFEKVNNIWFVKDLNSLNGLYVNGARINQDRRQLQIGDVIGFGVPNITKGAFVVSLSVRNPPLNVIKKEIDDDDVKIIEIPNHSFVSPLLPNKIHNKTVQEHSSDKIKSECQMSSLPSTSTSHIRSCDIPSVVPDTKKISMEHINLKEKSGSKLSKSQVQNPNHENTMVFKTKAETEYAVHNSKLDMHISNGNKTEIPGVCYGSEQYERNLLRRMNEEKMYVQIRDCYIPLVRCDSKHFHLPPGVIFGNLNNFSHMEISQKIIASTSDNMNSVIKRKNNIDFSSDGIVSTVPLKRLRLSQDLPAGDSESATFVAKPILSDRKEENFEYSQDDEIIYISDDDSFLDFNSSQLVIKSEPNDDIDDLRHENYFPEESSTHVSSFVVSNKADDEDLGLIMECENDCDFPSENYFSGDLSDSACKSKSTIVSAKEVNGDKLPSREENGESLEDIIKYVNSKSSSIELKQISQNGEERGMAIDAEDNDYFPVLSQNFYADDVVSDEVDNILTSNDNQSNIADIENSKNKIVRKSCGRTLLTDPKPLEVRPRKIRGREEGFVEQSKNSSNANSGRFRQKGKSNVKNDRILAKEHNEVKKATAPDLIKVTGKGLSNFKIPKKSTVNSDEMEKVAEKTSVQNGLKMLHSSGRLKKSSVPRRADNYGSRLGVLMEDMQKTKPPQNKKLVSMQAKNASSLEFKRKSQSSRINLNNMINSIHGEQSTSESKSRQCIPENSNISYQKTGFKIANASMTQNSQESHNLSEGQTTHLISDIPQQSTLLTSGKSCISGNDMHVTSFVKPKPVIPVCVADPRLKRYVRKVPVQSDKKLSEIDMNQNGNDHLKIVKQNNVHKPVLEKKTINNSTIKFYTVLEKVVGLNVKWVAEQKQIKYPPEAVTLGANPLPLYFSSLDSYISSFLPMLMLELWDLICQESKPIIADTQKTINKFYFEVLSCSLEEGMTKLSCRSVVNKLSFDPFEGNLIIMHVQYQDKCRNSIFGYINKHKVEKLTSDVLKSAVWSKMPEQWLSDARMWSFSVYTKHRPMPPKSGCLIKANGICSIRNRLRLADNFRDMVLSPLHKDIICPRTETFFVNYQSRVSPSRDFNFSQEQFIEGVTVELNHSLQMPKIILLQGPPGTGKTHTIVGLIERILYCNTIKGKILVTAPSNAAVDEIGVRLIKLCEQSRLQSHGIKFVRVGQPTQVHPEVLKYFLDERAFNLYNQTVQNDVNHRKKELLQLETKIKQLEEKMKSASNSILEANLQSLKSQWRNIKAQSSFKYLDYSVQNNYRQRVLKESDILLTTLGSCGQSILRMTFKPNPKPLFSCCIVDESTQCTELDMLQPLLYGMNKLILVGDHQQLPATVNSKLAVEYGFERSMFERFHIYFNKYHRESPLFTLREQYRMHSQICQFPSEHFYEGKLITSPDTDIRYENFKVLPYLVYDVQDGLESNASSSKANHKEALYIVQICTQLFQIDPKMPIGIITPYQGQLSLYKSALGHNPEYKSIEVNTVDGFQGREKDVIIFSSVRANNHGNIGFVSSRRRLNVAITRARKCLIICGHMRSLINDPHWKALIHDARQRGVYHNVSSYKDMPIVFRKAFKNVI